MEFEKLTDVLGLVTIYTAAAREHVAEIEREIWVVKEQTWCVITELLYQDALPDLSRLEIKVTKYQL